MVCFRFCHDFCMFLCLCYRACVGVWCLLCAADFRRSVVVFFLTSCSSAKFRLKRLYRFIVVQFESLVPLTRIEANNMHYNDETDKNEGQNGPTQTTPDGPSMLDNTYVIPSYFSKTSSVIPRLTVIIVFLSILDSICCPCHCCELVTVKHLFHFQFFYSVLVRMFCVLLSCLHRYLLFQYPLVANDVFIDNLTVYVPTSKMKCHIKRALCIGPCISVFRRSTHARSSPGCQ